MGGNSKHLLKASKPEMALEFQMPVHQAIKRHLLVGSMDLTERLHYLTMGVGARLRGIFVALSFTHVYTSQWGGQVEDMESEN